MLVTGNTTLTANYTKIYEPNPVGEVAIAMANGTVVWAMTNLSGNGTFANSALDYGCLFQWGYNDVIQNSTNTITMPNGGNAATTWPDSENPCPLGWRVPTRQELESLINTSYTSTTWADTADGSSNDGLTITPKSGDTGKKLFLPHAGGRLFSGADGGYRGNRGHYWSNTSDTNNANAYDLRFYTNTSMHVAVKSFGYSVRCVR